MDFRPSAEVSRFAEEIRAFLACLPHHRSASTSSRSSPLRIRATVVASAR